MGFHADQFRPGQRLSARALNDFAAELERLGRISIVAPITLADEAGGLALGIAVGEKIWVKLTSAGTGGKYAWTRMQGVTGGTWEVSSGGETGTFSDDPLIESTGKADVTVGDSKVYPASRDPISRALFFTAGNCP